MESFIRTILIILLIYFAFKLIIKWFGPLILRYFLKKIGNKFQQQFTQEPVAKNKKEGEVVIEKKPKAGKRSNKNVGDYIDYEEID